ncbi:uncharacterized protein FFUJ_11759 [Fusarium fujikuroi IMI 58289]|uniref:Uncharacterized protein n=2 Tax=Fusarium fujikuroi TaxID=5127 RepID=S0EL24_GIBF5|nr:uncharacterized protein FFUJ_11759 [Fusarium fujikuroi IMI 58289]KLP00240.1 uncharacterized protein Y057_7915 [Fusarium fujikuroi]KLP03855.1 uncharacterized protein LW94_8642 [Fusarium fujikuroi]QGI70983.1 hypothetical protein CEK27_003312 [Fusarium fujikuroi]QGI88317.1 hypothetical protein CEK25_003273 [Fusarium fujikuroi]QGJ01873.1 hypothetical protein CEK26_003317 [Fusarium fujikuroi]
MAASAIVASAIQALGSLPPVRLGLVAVPVISLSVLAVYSLLSGDNSNPYLTKRGFLHPFVTAEVKAICQVHYRIWNADLIREPETFFDILDLDTSKKPFVDNNWLTEGETPHHEAQKIIMEKWAERRNRLRGWGRASERAHHLDQVGKIMTNPTSARIYTLQFLSKIKHKRGDNRLGALEEVCKGFWEAPQFKKKKEL